MVTAYSFYTALLRNSLSMTTQSTSGLTRSELHGPPMRRDRGSSLKCQVSLFVYSLRLYNVCNILSTKSRNMGFIVIPPAFMPTGI